MITLHVFPPSPRAFKVLSVANYLEIPHRIAIVDLTKGEHRKPEFVALNLNKRMPVMEDEGFVLWEANAITQYLATRKPQSGLLPTEERARLDVTRWQFWDLAHWDSACATIIFERVVKQIFGMGAADAVEVAKGEERFHRNAAVLNEHLKGKRFICNALTLADFSIGAPLNLIQAAQLPVESYPEIQRWYKSLTEMPAWQKALAPVPAPTSRAA